MNTKQSHFKAACIKMKSWKIGSSIEYRSKYSNRTFISGQYNIPNLLSLLQYNSWNNWWQKESG